MALEVSAGYKRDVLAAMEGNEELEEGEACQANDSNYGSDLYFPHLESKLTEVLGHARKDFEGGYYPEKLGSKFGGYGTFLPTVPALPPQPAPAVRRLSPVTPCRPPGNNSSLEVTKHASTVALDNSADRQTSPAARPKQPDPAGTEVKPAITLRIKMGTEGRGKNAAIYNRLGFSPPSASEGEDDDLSGPDSSPDRSPASMIQIILSHRLPPEGLLSPLPDLTLRPVKRSAKVSDSGSTKKDLSKERRQSKTANLEDDNPRDLSGDSGRKEVELDRKQQEVRKEKVKVRSQSQDDAWKPPAARTEEPRVLLAKELFEEDERAVASVPPVPFRDGTAPKPRREEVVLAKDVHLDKRKSKHVDSDKRAKKRPKVNVSGLDARAAKGEKKSRGEGKPPKARDEKRMDRSTKEHTSSDVPARSSREDLVSSKERTGIKLKGGKRSKDTGEALPLADCSDVKLPEPPLQQPVAPVDGLPVPPAVIKENWVECDDCCTWRLLPPGTDPLMLSDRWRCEMITWLPPGMNNCKVSEQESTNAVYNSLGIPVPVDPLGLAGPAPLPAAVPELDKSSSKQILTKKPLRPDYEEAPAKSRALDVKLGKHVSKKKEKSRKHSTEARLAKDFQIQDARLRDTQDKAKKKRALNEELHLSKKLKTDEGSSLQRGRYPQTDGPSEGTPVEDDNANHSSRKPLSRTDGRRERPDEPKRGADGEGSQRVKVEDAEREERSSKSLKPERSTTKGKAVRVVEAAKASSRLSNDGLEPRRRKGSDNSPSYESVDTFKGRPADDARNINEFDARKRPSSADHFDHASWDEFNDQTSWDEDKQQAHQKACDRHGEDKADREGAPDDRGRRVSNGGSAPEERSRARDEKSSRKSARGSEGRESDESKPKVRLKNAEAVKLEHEEVEAADRDRRSGKEVVQRPNPVEETGKRGSAEALEGKHTLANSAIKAARSLKHHADRLKDDTAKDIYLQAALKFLQGGALMETVELYNETADLFKFCAHQYERGGDMPGALLAHKCAAIARFRMSLMKCSSLSRDRRELHSALHRAPATAQATPPTGESPSSSSASDLDNLNSQMIPVPVDKSSSTGKGPVSPLVQGVGTLPRALQPTLVRFVRNSADVFEAFEIWNKAENVLAALVASKTLAPDKLAALEKVASIGFSDVEALVCLVNQALEALGR